jgi:thiamine-phosphate pyrophosphorylase
MPGRGLPPLYAILDVDMVSARGWAPADVCRAWLDGGVRLIQLRAKSTPTGALLKLADRCAALCHAAGALFIINDRADIAVVCGADGVHVGQDDLSPTAARRVVGLDRWLGVSTHTDAQVQAAVEEPVSYVAIGPVCETRTKATGYQALGLSAVRGAAARVHEVGMPLVAIGGITLENVADVLGAGADVVAVISGLLVADDISGVEACAGEWRARTLGFTQAPGRL